jgi:hypothetical protein
MLSSGVRIEAPILSGRLTFASNPRMQGASEISRSGPPPSELRPSRVESCVRLPPQGKKRSPVAMSPASTSSPTTTAAPSSHAATVVRVVAAPLLLFPWLPRAACFLAPSKGKPKKNGCRSSKDDGGARNRKDAGRTREQRGRRRDAATSAPA